MNTTKNAIFMTLAGLIASGCGSDIPPPLPVFGTVQMPLSSPEIYTVANNSSTDAAIAIGDVNHDGIPDVVVATSATVEAFIGKGDGTLYTVPVTSSVGVTPSSINIVSLRNNAFNDVVVTNASDSTVSVLLGSGSGLGTQTTYAVQGTPVSAIVADINHDGLPDIITLNESGSSVSVLLSILGTPGTFSAAVNYAGLTGPVGFCMADFNQDGIEDLAVLNQADATISILLGNGNGTFQAAVKYGPYTGTVWNIGCGDFNRDGRPDVVFTSTNGSIGGTLNAVFGNGDGTLAAFSPANAFPVGNITANIGSGLIVGDFLKNGLLDVMVAAQTDSNLDVLWGTGTGSFSSPQNYPMSVGTVAIANGSLRNNGKLDWVTVGASATRFELFLAQ